MGIRALIVVDPVQDWEESTRIIGVFRDTDLDEAQEAALAYAAKLSERTRHIDIQEWRGTDSIGVWRWNPAFGYAYGTGPLSGEWSYKEDQS